MRCKKSRIEDRLRSMEGGNSLSGFLLRLRLVMLLSSSKPFGMAFKALSSRDSVTILVILKKST